MLNKVIIFPTDTVYGIGASIYDKNSIDEIYRIKGRDFTKPLAVLCANLNQVESFAIVDDKIKLIARAFWPGGLTLILNTKEEYYKFSKEKTIGVRIPNHKLALSLLEKYGPMKTTSVNRSGEIPLNDYGIIYNIYHDTVEDIYKNNERIEEVASTVIDMTNDMKVIRNGSITLSDIVQVLKK